MIDPVWPFLLARLTVKKVSDFFTKEENRRVDLTLISPCAAPGVKTPPSAVLHVESVEGSLLVELSVEDVRRIHDWCDQYLNQ